MILAALILAPATWHPVTLSGYSHSFMPRDIDHVRADVGAAKEEAS